MENVFEIIEHFTGTRIKPNNLNKLAKLNSKQTLELFEQIKHFYIKKYYFVDNNAVPIFSNNETRYAFLTDLTGSTDSAELWDNLDELKKILLYCPSVAILDPIDDILDFLLDYPNINSFINSLSLLLPIRQLVDQDIIRLVPGQTAISTVMKQIDIHPLLINILHGIDSIFEAVKVYNEDYYRFISTNNLELPGFSLTNLEKDVIRLAANDKQKLGLLTWTTLIVKDYFVKFTISNLLNSNIAFTSSRDTNFFAKLLGANNCITDKLGNYDDFVAKYILSLSIPKINNISWKDFISIRQSDQDFYFWRQAFKQVIRESYNKVSDYNENFLVNAQEILSAQSRSLNQAIKQKTSLKNKFSSAWLPAGIGFVAGALTGSIETAATSTILTGSLSLLFSLFVDQPNSSEKALYRHFGVFLKGDQVF